MMFSFADILHMLAPFLAVLDLTLISCPPKYSLGVEGEVLGGGTQRVLLVPSYHTEFEFSCVALSGDLGHCSRQVDLRC